MSRHAGYTRAMKVTLRILALVLLTQIGHTQDIAAARGFVQQLYKAYDRPASAPAYDVLGKSADRIFTPSLLRLIRLSAAKTPVGDAPALDGDPICDCQDSDGLHLAALTVTPAGPDRASAQATLRFPGETSPEVVRLALLMTPQGWRVDDTATADTPSLRRFLEQSH